MNDQELTQLVARIQLGDNRIVDGATIAHWRDTVGDLDYQDAMAAVSMHFRESVDYLKAAHIHRNVHRIREQRLLQHRGDELPAGSGDPKPDNWDAMCAAWADSVAFAAEVWKYQEQLQAA